MTTPFSFELHTTDGHARTGAITTSRGVIRTPVFMPVGTQGTVKTLSQEDLHLIGAQIILGNAYHLFLRPGTDVLEKAGGLHEFMSWPGPILTDSGGFQVFSLSSLNKVTKDGVRFQSHLDGSYHTFTPEKAIDVQQAIGADIIMCFDECTAYPATYDQAAESMRMTGDWAARCKRRWLDSGASQRHTLFGIVQGATYEELRHESVDRLVDIGFPGYAIGGVSVGETKQEMIAATEWSVAKLPDEKPRYLMGVGPPEDILEAVERGVDMFDCVMPTRNARNGSLFTTHGKLNIKNQANKEDFGPIDPDCRAPIVANYSRAYMSHLCRAQEVLALRLNTLHNLYFMLHFTANLRAAIRAGRYLEFKKDFLARYQSP